MSGASQGDDDPGAGRPHLSVADGQPENNRGLALLAGLTHDWGVTWTNEFRTTGKRVWFELRSVTGG